MFSKQNIVAVCLGLPIAATTLLCQLAWFRIVVGSAPILLLLLGPPLEGAIIIGCSGPVLLFAFCLSYLVFWYSPSPRKIHIVPTALIVLVAFPLLFLTAASTVENIFWTVALIGGTVLAIAGAAALLKKYPRHCAT